MADARRCRICGENSPPKAKNPTWPLCSDRCRMVDLGRWMGEAYVISTPLFPGLPEPPSEEEVEDPPGKGRSIH